MKRSALAVLLLVGFAGSVLVTMAAWFTNVGDEEGLVMERVGVVHGHLAGMLATASLWSKYPAMPSHLSALFSERAFLITVPLLLIGLSLGHIRGRRFPLQVAVCLGAALASHLAGSSVLRIGFGNASFNDPPVIGSWLAVMILGPLYAMAACALVCGAELLWPAHRQCPTNPAESGASES